MKRYFKINFEPDREEALKAIDERVKSGVAGFVAVCDGNILSMVQRDAEYREVIDGAMFSIMDSSWIPLYVKWKYGQKYRQYCGSDIFKDVTECRKYRQFFLGSSRSVLDGLKKNLTAVDPEVAGMSFLDLPYCAVEDFDYAGIAARINSDSPDIVWLSLGAPKQEQFAVRLLPYLDRGVVIPVGAVFDFRSGVSVRRAPQWMVKCRLEFVYRVFTEPRKQLRRCWGILSTLPLIFKEDGHSV